MWLTTTATSWGTEMHSVSTALAMRKSVGSITRVLHHAGIAQSAEQRTCNAQVVGAGPTTSSIIVGKIDRSNYPIDKRTPLFFPT